VLNNEFAASNSFHVGHQLVAALMSRTMPVAKGYGPCATVHSGMSLASTLTRSGGTMSLAWYKHGCGELAATAADDATGIAGPGPNLLANSA
jgi:hypothetical protein